MNASKLATAAALSTAPYLKAVSSEVAFRLELAHVAQWLYSQDDSADPARINAIAREAIALLTEQHAKG